MIPGFAVEVPATDKKVTAGTALGMLYKHLMQSGDDFNRHLVELLREDFNIGRVLKRDLLKFVIDDQSSHLGTVKAVAMLDGDDRFLLRLQKASWVLVGNPTPAQIIQVTDVISGLEIGAV